MLYNNIPAHNSLSSMNHNCIFYFREYLGRQLKNEQQGQSAIKAN